MGNVCGGSAGSNDLHRPPPTSGGADPDTLQNPVRVKSARGSASVGNGRDVKLQLQEPAGEKADGRQPPAERSAHPAAGVMSGEEGAPGGGGGSGGPDSRRVTPVATPTPKGDASEGSNFREQERARSEMAGDGRKPKIAQSQSFSTSVLGRRTEDVETVYRLGRKLGQGQFGTTFLCTERSSGREFACKSIPKRKLITAEDVDDVKREVAIMHHLTGHPGIVAIQGAYEDTTAVHIVMELCSGGELFDRIISKGHYSERKAAHLTKTIVGVVETCHSLGVMHRDLKPENFLLSDDREDSALKATDFGLSIFFRPGEMFADVVGSPYYVAPEVLRRSYGPEIDVWSAGIIVYILLSGVPPFWAETEQGIFEAVLRGDIDFESDPWPLISNHAKDLIRKMLQADPKKRLTAYQVLCHPWVATDGVAPDKPLDSAVLSRLKQFTATNKLKKMALRVIAESMSEEEIAGLKEMFKMIDTDSSGTITFEELKAGLHRVGTKLNDNEVREIMDAADVDSNGSIDYKEFLAATLHLNKIEREETLYAAFRHFDKDDSGNISIEELQQACREFNIDDSSIVDIMKDVDTNNDGHIDYSEFVTMMRMGNGGAGRKSLHSQMTGGILGFLQPPKSPVA